MKRCSACGESKPLHKFGLDSRKSYGRQARCRECEAKRRRERYPTTRAKDLATSAAYYAANRNKLAENQRVRYQEARAAVLSHYGSSCACCRSTERLTIDHMSGDGAEHRRALFGKDAESYRMYRWLIDHDFPSGFQTLCQPCNASKGQGDRCLLLHAVEEAKR